METELTTTYAHQVTARDLLEQEEVERCAVLKGRGRDLHGTDGSRV